MTEMDKLEDYLNAKDFNYIRKPLYDGEQIIVYNNKGVQLWDAVCHSGSYGHERGLLEIMGDITKKRLCDNIILNDVEGYITAENIIERLEGVKC